MPDGPLAAGGRGFAPIGGTVLIAMEVEIVSCLDCLDSGALMVPMRFLHQAPVPAAVTQQVASKPANSH